MRKTTVLIVFLILFSFSLCFQSADEETLSNIEGNYNKLVLFFADSFLRIDRLAMISSSFPSMTVRCSTFRFIGIH